MQRRKRLAVDVGKMRIFEQANDDRLRFKLDERLAGIRPQLARMAGGGGR